MQENNLKKIRSLLASKRPDEVREGLRLAETEISRVGAIEAKPLFEMITALFYIDTLDHPGLAVILDEAVNLTARFGPSLIPDLIDNLDEGDIKAQWAAAHVLGRIGERAIRPLMEAYASTENPSLQAFILYATGKIKSPQIVQAAPAAIDAAQSKDLELRDTACRALGKIIESIPPELLSQALKQKFLECLYGNLSDPNASVRSKAIRSLGKMAKYGHLTDSECGKLETVCRRLTGTDENNDWDRAFIVRKEADEALANIKLALHSK